MNTFGPPAFAMAVVLAQSFITTAAATITVSRRACAVAAGACAVAAPRRSDAGGCEAAVMPQKQYVYRANLCQLNTHRLLTSLVQTCSEDAKLHAVVMSAAPGGGNPYLWGVRGGSFREWKFHVFGLLTDARGQHHVLDLDSTLPWPTSGAAWVEGALRYPGARLFRVVSAPQFLESGLTANFIDEFVSLEASYYGQVMSEREFAAALVAGRAF